MSKLNCSIGDLAITVKANLPANLGNIVRIIGSQGLQYWEGQDEPLYIWDVEIVGGRSLFALPLRWRDREGQKRPGSRSVSETLNTPSGLSNGRDLR